MKKFLFILIFFIIHLSAFAQTKYPRFEIDSSGNKIVLMTIEQAQKLDNNTELLSLFEKLNPQIGDYDTICIKVLGEKDKIINFQIVQISELRNLLLVKDEKILNLLKTSEGKEAKISNLNEIISNKDREINLHLKEIKKTKARYLIGGSLGGAILGIVIISII